PLADVIAVAFAAPLFMTVLSVPMLGERVGPRRWAALSVGFVGVIVTLRPFGGGFDPVGLLALASAAFYAFMLITSRQLSATESSITILFYYSIGVIVVTGAAMPWQWITPTWSDAGLFLAGGIIGSFGLAIARRLALAGQEVLILESEPTIGSSVSSRNSEVIHAGLYYQKDSLRARLCLAGKRQLYDYCAAHGVPHRRLGKLVVATADDQLPALHALRQRAIGNGVDDT